MAPRLRQKRNSEIIFPTGVQTLVVMVADDSVETNLDKKPGWWEEGEGMQKKMLEWTGSAEGIKYKTTAAGWYANNEGETLMERCDQLMRAVGLSIDSLGHWQQEIMSRRERF